MKRWRDAVVSNDVAKFRKFGHGSVPPEPLALPTMQPELVAIDSGSATTALNVSNDPYEPPRSPRERPSTDQLDQAQLVADEQTSFPDPHVQDDHHHLAQQDDTPLDPSLLQTAQDSSAVVAAALARVEEANQLDINQRPQYFDPAIQVFFRRSATSPEARPGEPSLWSGTLTICTLDNLCKAALDGYPAVCKLAYDIRISNIEGIAASADGLGEETLYRVDDDFELAAYLSHIGIDLTGTRSADTEGLSSASTATFSVSLSASDIGDVA